jgi:hypothetical protein
MQNLALSFTSCQVIACFLKLFKKQLHLRPKLYWGLGNSFYDFYLQGSTQIGESHFASYTMEDGYFSFKMIIG